MAQSHLAGCTPAITKALVKARAIVAVGSTAWNPAVARLRPRKTQESDGASGCRAAGSCTTPRAASPAAATSSRSSGCGGPALLARTCCAFMAVAAWGVLRLVLNSLPCWHRSPLPTASKPFGCTDHRPAVSVCGCSPTALATSARTGSVQVRSWWLPELRSQAARVRPSLSSNALSPQPKGWRQTKRTTSTPSNAPCIEAPWMLLGANSFWRRITTWE